MKNILLSAALFTVAASMPAFAQEGAVPTQTILQETKGQTPLTAATLTLRVNNRETPVSSVSAVRPAGAQIALLLDDGLRQSFGRNLEDMRRFITGLPAETEVFIGYMSNGRVIAAQTFTTDHAAAAEHLRITLGQPGISASPYFCLSEFVKHWPGTQAESTSRNPEALQPLGGGARAGHKARFVLMMSNGVDPYNGSVSPLNQDSPYVAAAISDAQRAGVSVSSIYYGDAGIRGGAASFSGQGYLSQVADATGGTAYYEGVGNPVNLTPFFTRFQRAVAESYVATFEAAGKDLVQLKATTSLPGVKLRHASEIHPGTQLMD